MERDDGVEEAVDALSLGLEVDPEVAREEQVGLAGLDRDADRSAPRVEIPGALEDVVLGDDPTLREAERLALDRDDPVHEHERLAGEADPCRMGVDRREPLTEDAADLADRELEALGAVHEDASLLLPAKRGGGRVGGLRWHEGVPPPRPSARFAGGGRLALEQGEELTLERETLLERRRGAHRRGEERLVGLGGRA